MRREPTHPLAEHPLDRLDTKVPSCAFPLSGRGYLMTALLESSLRQCAPYVRGKLLDVGCGHRPYEKTYFSAAESYLGTDYLTDRSRPDIVASALDLPFDANTFDTVTSTEVLEHLVDPLRALTEMHRVLKPDGYLILSVPMHWPRHEQPYDYWRFTYDGLLHLLQESRFEVVRLFNRGRSYIFLGQVVQHIQPIPFAWFSALINRFSLWCDRHLKHDLVTLGWTVVARPVDRDKGESAAARSVKEPSNG
jgi:SAM-dependent methyltransferase